MLFYCRNARDDCCVVELESDSWSDDSVSDKLSRSLSNNSSSNWDAVSEDSGSDHDGLWSMSNKLGCLYFQYIEMSSPYCRVPLTDKVTRLFCWLFFLITGNSYKLLVGTVTYELLYVLV